MRVSLSGRLRREAPSSNRKRGNLAAPTGVRQPLRPLATACPQLQPGARDPLCGVLVVKPLVLGWGKRCGARLDELA